MTAKLVMAGDKNTYDFLLPGETLISITHYDDVKPSSAPSARHELQRLARAGTLQQIGSNGPVLASLALEAAGRQEDGRDFHLLEAVFGRDSLKVAMDLIDVYPELARGTLLFLAAHQGVIYNATREEEPGRIPHEIRDPNIDPRAVKLTKERGWGWPYYGAVDTTPEFVRLLARYCSEIEDALGFLRHTAYVARDGRTRLVLESLDAAVSWMVRRMSANAEGFIESKTPLPDGIENQLWRDSWDGFSHADGSVANHQKGIAALDVQRVTYDALLDAADLYEKYLGRADKAEELCVQAGELKKRILNSFWTEEKNGYFVLGLDRDENNNWRQMKIRTSDMGHLLNSRLLMGNDQEIVRRRNAVIRQLFSGEMMGLNGIRTLAYDEVRYRPGAYQNGSVWVCDNYQIFQGLIRHKETRLATLLAKKMFEGVWASRRFAEYLRGDDDPNHRINAAKIVLYDHVNGRENLVEQPPQDIQAWTVSAIICLERAYAKDITHWKREFLQKNEKSTLRSAVAVA